MATAALTAGVIRSRDEDQQLGSTVGGRVHRVRHPRPSRGSARLGGGYRPEPTLSLARKLSPGLLLAFGEYPDSWMIGGDDRDDAGLELDGWSYPRLESWPIPTQAVRTVSQAPSSGTRRHLPTSLGSGAQSRILMTRSSEDTLGRQVLFIDLSMIRCLWINPRAPQARLHLRS